MRFQVKDSAIPKYAQLRDYFLEAIQSGELREGDQLPTEDVLVKDLAVSRNTVRRAISDLLYMGVVVRKQGRGTFVCSDSGNRQQNALVGSQAIGVLVRDIASPDDVYPDIIRGVQDVAGEYDQHVMLANTDGQPEKLKESLNRFLRMGVTGVVVSPVIDPPHMSTRELRQYGRDRVGLYQQFVDAGMNMVLINRSVPGLNVPCVKCDNVLGGYLATRHLIAQGHSRIAAVFPPPYITVREREQGYRKALAESGLQVLDGYVQYAHLDDSEPIETMVSSILGLAEPPTGVFAFTDDFAARIMDSLSKRGIRVPDEMALVGYNDCRVALSLEVPLTSVAYPKYEIGKRAAEILFQPRSEGAEAPCIVLPPELVVRASSVREAEAGKGDLVSASAR